MALSNVVTNAVVSSIAGVAAAGVLVAGGVATYTAVTTDDTQQTDPNSIGYADAAE